MKHVKFINHLQVKLQHANAVKINIKQIRSNICEYLFTVTYWLIVYLMNESIISNRSKINQNM